MAWLAVHPSNTSKVRVPDEDGAPTFEVGFWPPRVSERLKVWWQKLRSPGKELDPVADFEELLERTGLHFDAASEMVKYSVRSWEGFGDVKCSTLVEKIDGMDHVVLSPESMFALHANQLTVALSLKALLFNVMSEDQKKTSGLQ